MVVRVRSGLMSKIERDPGFGWDDGLFWRRGQPRHRLILDLPFVLKDQGQGQDGSQLSLG
jgi:hypothetical protein